MKVVVAIDSLKGSLSSLGAGDTIRAGILKADSSAGVLVRPPVDDGKSTVEALTVGMGGTLQEVRVTGPFGAPVTAVYGILQDGKTAIFEMAAAAGITLIEEKGRNPLSATTYGVEEMVRDAIFKGYRHLIMGTSGSATGDGGISMLQALGYGLLDSKDKQVPFGAKGLQVLDRISDEKVMPELTDYTFRVACGVTNTLYGSRDYSAVFGPQKGVDPSMVMQMDKWLAYYATLAREKHEKVDPRQAETSTTGGLGFAFLTFTDMQPESGIKVMLEETRPEDYMKEADLAITGKGRLDGQITMGKALISVVHIAKQYGKPVITFAGVVAQDATTCNARGIGTSFPILCRISTLQETTEPENTRQNMTDTVEQALRLFLFK